MIRQSKVVFGCFWRFVSAAIREKYGVNEDLYENLSSLMNNHDPVQLVDFIDECMKLF